MPRLQVQAANVFKSIFPIFVGLGLSLSCLVLVSCSDSFDLSAVSGKVVSSLKSGVEASEPDQARIASIVESGLVDYVDPIAGFAGKLPVGWTRITLGENFGDGSTEDYAVTFESPASGDTDVFADYLMVEFRSGAEADGFIADASERVAVSIDGRSTHVEKLFLNDFDVGDVQLDLVVFQITQLEIGYSLGLYMVGEKREEKRLAEIFDAFIRSFEFPDNPMQVSDVGNNLNAAA